MKRAGEKKEKCELQRGGQKATGVGPGVSIDGVIYVVYVCI